MKEHMSVADMIVVSAMNSKTGNYSIILVSNPPRWKKDSAQIPSHWLCRVELSTLGHLADVKTYFSMEEFNETYF